MIARTWQGWAPPETADDYLRHYQTDVAEHLRQIPGFLDARLLRLIDDAAGVVGTVRFTSITYFTDLDAVRAFAGPDYELAVLEDAARRALSHWDERVVHHEVIADLS